jgi:hypothetical protein
MTTLLQKAFAAAEKLSEPEQDWLGQQWLADIEHPDKRWEKVLSENAGKADKLEAMILAEIGAGGFEPLEKFLSSTAREERR